MASVQTWSIRDHERDRATEGPDDGCICHGFTPYGNRLVGLSFIGDPLDTLLKVERIALEQGYSNANEFVAAQAHNFQTMQDFLQSLDYF